MKISKINKTTRHQDETYDYKFNGRYIKPGNNKIRNYTKRQRKIKCVGEFTQYGSKITYRFDHALNDWDDAIDRIFDVCDMYNVDTVIGWDTKQLPTLKSFEINIFERNKGRALDKAFVDIIACEINEVAFKGTIESIVYNYDGVWDD